MFGGSSSWATANGGVGAYGPPGPSQYGSFSSMSPNCTLDMDVVCNALAFTGYANVFASKGYNITTSGGSLGFGCTGTITGTIDMTGVGARQSVITGKVVALLLSAGNKYIRDGETYVMLNTVASPVGNFSHSTANSSTMFINAISVGAGYKLSTTEPGTNSALTIATLNLVGDSTAFFNERGGQDRKSTRLNSSHSDRSRMPSSA